MIEGLLSFSVRRRWAVLVLTAVVAGIGMWSLGRLPVDAVPDITNNQVQINTLAPALSPVDVEKQITYPIETALAGTPGLQYTRSLSRNGFSQVTAVFSDRMDVYFARQQVLERLQEARDAMPLGVEPKLGPISTGLGEIVMWTVSFSKAARAVDGKPGWQTDGSYLTPEGRRLETAIEQAAYLREIQDWVIRPQVRLVPGVAGVDAIGGFVKQYHVEPDPAKLVALGLSFDDLALALERGNLNRGAGYLERNGEGIIVRSRGQLQTTGEIADVVVTARGGVPVRVRDVATVAVGRELRSGSASRSGEEVVVGTALMVIGGNGRTISSAVVEKLDEVQKTLPPDIAVNVALDRTQLVDATIATVATNLAEGALLVVAVLFLFLGNIRAAFIVALVIPVSMLITATGMVEGRISANLMSLGALDFGLIVDGAVIIAENCLRRLGERQHELGRLLRLDERLETVSRAAREMIEPSVYGQAIIILVYVPLLTFTGVEGKMFEPMALTVICALAAAFVLSLTAVPAMIAIFIRGRVEEKENRLVRSLKAAYRPVLGSAVRRPLPYIALAVALFDASVFAFGRLGQEFVPTLDEKNLAMHALRIPSTSLTQSQAMQTRVEKALSAAPEVAFVFSKTGTAEVSTDPMPPNASDTFIILKPRADWPEPALSKDDLIARLNVAVSRLPGNVYEFTQPIQMRFNELLAGVRGDLAVKVFGEDPEAMLKAANGIAGILRQTSGAVDVKVEQAEGLPFMDISIDRNEAARLGISVGTIQDIIGASIGGRKAGVVFEGDRRFAIVVRLPEAVRDDLAALENTPVPLPQAQGAPPQSVPLKRVARFEFSEGPNQVSRENGKRRVVVQANARGRDIASLVAEAQARVKAEVVLPAGSFIQWGGQFENLALAKHRLSLVVPACLLLIFLLLFSALGSARDAALVFTAVPLALTGGIAALWLRDMPFSVSAAVGFIALSGIAVLNGLVMLSYIQKLQKDGVPRRDAVVTGALGRLRPVFMTALVASLGFVPMALATGTGAEVQRPLATVVIGGVISATLLTLVVLPALYARFGSTFVTSMHRERKIGTKEPQPAAPVLSPCRQLTITESSRRDMG